MSINKIEQAFSHNILAADFTGVGPFTTTLQHNLNLEAPIVDLFVDPGGGFEKFLPLSITVSDPNSIEIEVTSVPVVIRAYVV